tara:strand:+ start:388 stop:1257 length:870 start_codon:yes stop_codon:yes gene_type:complete
MKKLFEFTIPQTIKEVEEVKSTGENGEEITTKKEVEKVINKTVILKKPTRSLFDEGDLFFGIKLSEGIKAGLLTRQMLSKRFSNDGGVLSEGDKDRYAELYLAMFESQNDIEKITMIPESDRTEEEKETFSNAIKKASVVREEIQSFELDQASLFDNTAENRARNKTILWWVLHLSYFLEQDGSHTSIYGEGTYDQRLEKYDELEEDENDFWVTLSKKLIYYISFWYVGRASSEEDFKNLVTEFERSGGVPLDEAAEEMIQEAQEEPEEEPEEVKQVERREEETKKEGE